MNGYRYTEEQAQALINKGPKGPATPQKSTKPKPKRLKFGNVPTWVDGIRFDSAGEAERWQALEILEKAGVIKDLMRQVTFNLTVNGILIADYRADFVYYQDGSRVVEDWKGVRTDEFRMKANLMKAIKGIVILETGK